VTRRQLIDPARSQNGFAAAREIQLMARFHFEARHRLLAAQKQQKMPP
jgi:hypothetical protein